MFSGFFRRPQSGRTQSALLVLLLLVTLGVSVVFTQQGNSAARGEEKAVRQVLNYSGILIAGRYAEQAELDLQSVAGALLRPYWQESTTLDDLQKFEPVSIPSNFETQCPGCDPTPYLDFHFAFDHQSGEFAFKGGKPAAKELEKLALVLKNHPRIPIAIKWASAVAAHEELPGRTIVFASMMQLDDKGRQVAPLKSVGFVAARKMIAHWLTPIDAFRAGIRAPAVVSKNFEVAVLSMGDTLLQSGPAGLYPSFSEVALGWGGFQIMATAVPSSVPTLASSNYRVYVFLGLLALSTVLIFAVIFLFRREAELAQARTDFVSGVSHELRTPLAQIRMFTETLLLGRTRNETERRRSLEIIDQEAKRLTALVDNVLSLSRAERGTARLAPAATELAPTIREVVDTFSQLPRARSVEIRPELEQRLVATVDPNAFRQILLNLLDNAVKYGPTGQRVVVGLAMFEEHARLWVDDEGPGIPARERERVFEPFYRSSLHSDSRVNGSGIGLAVVRELAVLLNGSAWAEEAPGGGARIVVEFPEAYLRAEEATGGWAVA